MLQDQIQEECNQQGGGGPTNWFHGAGGVGTYGGGPLCQKWRHGGNGLTNTGGGGGASGGCPERYNGGGGSGIVLIAYPS